VRGRYPIRAAVTVTVVPERLVSRNRPRLSVRTNAPVPSTVTRTPSSALPVRVSTTVPATSWAAARAAAPARRHAPAVRIIESLIGRLRGTDEVGISPARGAPGRWVVDPLGKGRDAPVGTRPLNQTGERLRYANPNRRRSQARRDWRISGRKDG